MKAMQIINRLTVIASTMEKAAARRDSQKAKLEAKIEEQKMLIQPELESQQTIIANAETVIKEAEKKIKELRRSVSEMEKRLDELSRRRLSAKLYKERSELSEKLCEMPLGDIVALVPGNIRPEIIPVVSSLFLVRSPLAPEHALLSWERGGRWRYHFLVHGHLSWECGAACYCCDWCDDEVTPAVETHFKELGLGEEDLKHGSKTYWEVCAKKEELVRSRIMDVIEEHCAERGVTSVYMRKSHLVPKRSSLKVAEACDFSGEIAKQYGKTRAAEVGQTIRVCDRDR